MIDLPTCPVETTLTLIGDKWKVLTAQLRDMEEKGLLTHKVYAEVPPGVECTLLSGKRAAEKNAFSRLHSRVKPYHPVA